MKSYVPVGAFEQGTSHCPTYLAWLVLDEVRDYFRAAIPESYATGLARRAEIVFVKNPVWRRKFRGRHGREQVLAGLRHWLAGILARENPALFRELPESFKLGAPLPPRPKSRSAAVPAAGTLDPVRSGKRAKNSRMARRSSHFVHGGELLAV